MPNDAKSALSFAAVQLDPSSMKRKLQHALTLLRASAAEHELPLNHLSDEELLDAVALVCRSFAWEGAAPDLIAAGHFKMGFAFADLWAAAKMHQDYRPRALGVERQRVTPSSGELGLQDQARVTSLPSRLLAMLRVGRSR